MTEERIRDSLREMRQDPVPPDSLARVRLAVAGRIQARGWKRPLGARWTIAGALVAVASLALVIVWRPAGEPMPKPASPVVARQPLAAPAGGASPTVRAGRPVQPVVRPAAKSARRAERESPSGDTVLIRIETSDPDVVILLAGEGAGS